MTELVAVLLAAAAPVLAGGVLAWRWVVTHSSEQGTRGGRAWRARPPRRPDA